MLKLLPLIFENEVDQEEDLGKPTILSEKGYNFLKVKVDDLNKKATKWNVPLMELKILREFFTKKTLFINISTGNPTSSDDHNAEKRDINVKEYEIQLLGEPPSVDGYEFIAKIEHTIEGNILNYAPKASTKNLPTEFRTAMQKCDVCHTNRERNNTFILRLEKDDPVRFSTKKSGDYIMVGSACLKRFLPNISASSLIGYAELIEQIRNSVKEAIDMDDYGEGFGKSKYIQRDTLSFWLAAEYLHTGKYYSKKSALEFNRQSTVQSAINAMYSKMDQHEDPVHKRVREDESFKQNADTLSKEYINWSKTYDFNKLADIKPEMSDYFHNLSVVSKLEMLTDKNVGYFGGVFQTFLMTKRELERKTQLQSDNSHLIYLGQPGQKLKATVKVNKLKEYESQYGRGLIVNLSGITTEKDPRSGQEGKKEGNLLYFTGTNFELNENEEADVEFTVKGHQINKYTNLPETQITRMKVLNFITHPEKNVGKQKVKEMSGTVKIQNISEYNSGWNQPPTHFITFSYSTKHHPDMRQIGTNWGINFSYQIPDESTFKTLKPYENKLVDANWVLDRATTLDKLKTSGSVTVTKFNITKILDDIPT